VFDAWGKIQSGVLDGNVNNYGDFDSCLGFTYEAVSVGLIKGKHCMVSYTGSDANDGTFNFNFNWQGL
jgi:hypothetical protein